MTESSAPTEVLIEAAARIPIRNVWYLLLYAWDMANYRGDWPVEAETSPNLLGLLARILCSATRVLLRRQLGRAFVTCSETFRGIRGRIDLTTSLKRQTFQRGAAHCTFSELNVNTPKNRILRATLRHLASDPRLWHAEPQLETRMRHEIRTLVRALEDVPLMPISSTDFSRLQLGRNDRDYALPLAICALVHRLEMPTESVGDHAMFALLRDEIRFHQLFERFIRNFCRLHFPGCHVQPEILKWPDELGCELVPAMRTDVSITAKDPRAQRLIVDTKYYVSTLGTSLYGTEKFKSDNLYQVYAYLRTQEQRGPSHRSASGMLLYPTTSYTLKETMAVQGHRIWIATVNLSESWQKIETNLLGLIGCALTDHTSENQ
jgi:5-methylcytosine-specific restriction enzyme subunit McrC